MSLVIVGLDNTIVNVALPSIRRDLHTSVSGLQWTIDAYTLVLASLVMLGGSTGDRFGRRRTFQTGLLLFTLGSLLCSLAPNLDILVACRMLQAVGGSMLNPVAMSIITNVFDDPRERAQAIGVWGGVVGISLAAGPIVGGALVSSIGWRSIFWINIPVGIAGFVLAARFVPESRAAHARRFDPVGQASLIALFASVTYTIIEAPTAGWGSTKILTSMIIAVGALASVLYFEPRSAEPLIDLRFFRSAPFSGASIIALGAFGALGGFLFLNTLYLQDARHLSPLHAGLDVLPMALPTLVLAPVSGRIVGSRGARIPLVFGGVMVLAGSLMLTRMSDTTSFTWLFFAYLCFGSGFGAVNPPITNAAVSGMPRSQAGVAAGVASTSRQIGSSLGVAVVGALATSAERGPLHLGLAAATHPGWWVVAGCGAVMLVLAFVTTSGWALGTARRAADRLVVGPRAEVAAEATLARSGGALPGSVPTH